VILIFQASDILFLKDYAIVVKNVADPRVRISVGC